MSTPDVISYLGEQFDRIPGWCAPHLWNLIQPLHDFQRSKGIRGPIAEIGVFQGKFFVGLALTKKDEGRHAAFDVFNMQQFNLDGAGNGNLERFRANLSNAGFGEDDYSAYEVDSMSINTDLLADVRRDHGLFSMFSVDGCHMAEHTINDFRIASELTQPGGIIFVDDYLNQDWPGVAEGMARLYLNDCPRFVPIAYSSNKLFTAHISYAAEMFTYLCDTIPKTYPGNKLKRVKRFGYDCLNVKPDPASPRINPQVG